MSPAEPTRRQLERWLRRLARSMGEHGLRTFFLEKLQPSWLDEPIDRVLYLVATRVACGVLVGICIGWAGALLGLAMGLAVAVVDAVRFELSRAGSEEPSLAVRAAYAIGVLAIAAAVWVMMSAGEDPALQVMIVLIAGFFLRRGSGRHPREDIRTVDTLGWSWWRFGGILLPGLLLVYLVALASRDSAFGALIPYLAVPLLFAAVYFGGLRGRRLPDRELPADRIRLSFGCGWRAGASSLLALPIVFALIVALDGWTRASKWFVNLDTEIPTLLAAAALVALAFGGMDVIQHYLLRAISARRGYLPWRLEWFLEAATRRIVLRKLGVGYLFIHPLLQDHFATAGEGRTELPDLET